MSMKSNVGNSRATQAIKRSSWRYAARIYGPSKRHWVIMSKNTKKFDDDVIEAIKCAGLPENEGAIAEAIQLEVDSKGEMSQDQRKALIAGAVAFVAVGGLLTPSRSEAMIGSFINSIISRAIAPIMSLLEALLGDVLSLFSGFITGGAESQAGAISTSADAQNHVRKTIEDNRIKADTAPNPDICGSDALGE